MQISYDKEADALAIWLKNAELGRTVDITEDIFIDLDEIGRLAGAEVLHVSEKYDLVDLLDVSIESSGTESGVKIPCRPTTYGTGHKDPDSHYSKFKNAIRTAMNGIYTSEDSSVKIEAIVYIDQERCRKGRNELDNFLKGIIDALNEANCFESEHQIDEISIKRILVDGPWDEGLVITIRELKDKKSSVQMIPFISK